MHSVSKLQQMPRAKKVIQEIPVSSDDDVENKQPVGEPPAKKVRKRAPKKVKILGPSEPDAAVSEIALPEPAMPEEQPAAEPPVKAAPVKAKRAPLDPAKREVKMEALRRANEARLRAKIEREVAQKHDTKLQEERALSAKIDYLVKERLSQSTPHNTVHHEEVMQHEHDGESSGIQQALFRKIFQKV